MKEEKKDMNEKIKVIQFGYHVFSYDEGSDKVFYDFFSSWWSDIQAHLEETLEDATDDYPFTITVIEQRLID